eukprot:2188229-Pleurochrysis_carterae.AAC.1
MLPHVPKLVPLLISVVECDASSQRVPSITAIAALEGFGPALVDYTSLLLPATLGLLQSAQPSSRAQKEALLALQRFATYLPLSRIACELASTLLNLLRAQDDVEVPVRQLMCHLVCQLGSAWRVLQDQVRLHGFDPVRRCCASQSATIVLRQETSRCAAYVLVEMDSQ